MMTSFSGEPGERAHRNLRSRPAPPQRAVPAGPALSPHRLRPGRLARRRRGRWCSTARPGSMWTRGSAPPRCASPASSTTRRSPSRRSTGTAASCRRTRRSRGCSARCRAPARAARARSIAEAFRDGEGAQVDGGPERGRREPQRHPAARTAHRRRKGRLGARLGDAGERQRRRGRDRRSSTRSTPPISARSRSSSRNRRR